MRATKKYTVLKASLSSNFMARISSAYESFCFDGLVKKLIARRDSFLMYCMSQFSPIQFPKIGFRQRSWWMHNTVYRYLTKLLPEKSTIDGFK